jgi:3'(2'), 5'-bisphosphate nucleotidase
MTARPEELLAAISDIARRAAAEILDVYRSGHFATREKSDDSPLTAADLRSHQLIVAALGELTPGLPVLSEESAHAPYSERTQWQRYWLVDPLDGTREFLGRNGEFTVNIALIEGHAPLLGVVHVPVSDVSYQGLSDRGAWRQDGAGTRHAIRIASRSAAPVRIVGSRSHRGDSLARFLERLGPHELLPVGSAVKFCLVAEGAADVYPRLGPTSEWDTAAAHAVLLGAGGKVLELSGAPLSYNARAELINPSFVAFGPNDHDWRTLLQEGRDAPRRES